MPRGFKKDSPLTKMLRANGLLLDRRSFVGYDAEMIPHLLLKGDDVIVQRQRVWRKSRGKCGICKTKLVYEDFEMDHKRGGSFGRCDCLHNLQAAHRSPCHQSKHVQLKPRKVGDYVRDTAADARDGAAFMKQRFGPYSEK
jgi:hypothetical protein